MPQDRRRPAQPQPIIDPTEQLMLRLSTHAESRPAIKPDAARMAAEVVERLRRGGSIARSSAKRRTEHRAACIEWRERPQTAATVRSGASSVLRPSSSASTSRSTGFSRIGLCAKRRSMLSWP